jgi:hypothetical protein
LEGNGESLERDCPPFDQPKGSAGRTHLNACSLFVQGLDLSPFSLPVPLELVD